MRPIAANLNHAGQPPLTLGDIVSRRKCLSFFENDHVKIILPLLQESDVPAAGVLDDEGRLCGLLSERGILRHIFAYTRDKLIHESNINKYLDDMLVRDAMMHRPESMPDNLPLEEAAALMLRRGYRFMPVVSRYDNTHFLGIIGETELVAQLNARLQHLKRSETAQQAILSYMLAEPYGRGADI